MVQQSLFGGQMSAGLEMMITIGLKYNNFRFINVKTYMFISNLPISGDTESDFRIDSDSTLTPTFQFFRE